MDLAVPNFLLVDKSQKVLVTLIKVSIEAWSTGAQGFEYKPRDETFYQSNKK